MSRIKLSDGSSWPLPCMDSEGRNVEWVIRYAPETLTREDLLQAASIISAYGYLTVEAPDHKVRLVRREIMEHLQKEAMSDDD